MNIGLSYDLQTDPTDERQAEFDPPETLDALADALRDGGHALTWLGSARDIISDRAILGGVELVFNIAEGQGTRCREAEAPMLFELQQVPYVGSDPLALMMGLDKALCKQLARVEGVPTPAWVTVSSPAALPDPLPVHFPVIVKPRYEGSGRGIGPGAIADNMAQLRARATWLHDRCPGPLLIEEFVGWGELTVCLIGNEPGNALPAIQRAIDPATRLSCHVITPRPLSGLTPVELTDSMDLEARRLAERMFQTLGCRDVARVDFRVDRAGRPQFLEINPLPSYDPEGTFALLAEYLGTSYAELVNRVLSAALLRHGITEPKLPVTRY